MPVGEGEYEAAFVPTATGTTPFASPEPSARPVDESVTSGPTTFNSVESPSTIEFPQPRPDPVQLQTAVAEADAAATTARTLGIAGIVAGALGLIVGAGLGGRGGPRQRQRRTPANPQASYSMITSPWSV